MRVAEFLGIAAFMIALGAYKRHFNLPVGEEWSTASAFILLACIIAAFVCACAGW